MACCIPLYYCTPAGIVRVLPDPAGHYHRPGGATAGPFATIAEVSAACRMTSCAACQFTYSSICEVSFENVSGTFPAGIYPLYLGLDTPGGCNLSGLSQGIATGDCCPWMDVGANIYDNCGPFVNRVAGGNPVTLQLVFASGALSGPGHSEFWQFLTTNCSLVPLRNTKWISVPSGYTIAPTPFSDSVVKKDVGYPCGTGDFFGTRRLLGRIQLYKGTSTVVGEADVFVQP